MALAMNHATTLVDSGCSEATSPHCRWCCWKSIASWRNSTCFEVNVHYPVARGQGQIAPFARATFDCELAEFDAFRLGNLGDPTRLCRGPGDCLTQNSNGSRGIDRDAHGDVIAVQEGVFVCDRVVVQDIVDVDCH